MVSATIWDRRPPPLLHTLRELPRQAWWHRRRPLLNASDRLALHPAGVTGKARALVLVSSETETRSDPGRAELSRFSFGSWDSFK